MRGGEFYLAASSITRSSRAGSSGVPECPLCAARDRGEVPLVSAQLGGSARDYQEPFASLAALQSRLWPGGKSDRMYVYASSRWG
jgi:hypothetical protein